MLKLNRDKTELLVIGPKHKVNPAIKGIHVAGEYIEVSNNARNWFPCQLRETCYEHLQNGLLSFTKYRVFSLTWPAYMQIYWNKRKSLHKKRVQLPEDWFGTPIWPPWRHVKTLYSKIRNCLSQDNAETPRWNKLFHLSWISVMLFYMAYLNRLLIGYSMYKTAQLDWWLELEAQNI